MVHFWRDSDAEAGEAGIASRVLLIEPDDVAASRLVGLLAGCDNGTIALSRLRDAAMEGDELGAADLILFGPGAAAQAGAFSAVRSDLPRVLVAEDPAAHPMAVADAVVPADSLSGRDLYRAIRAALESRRRAAMSQLNLSRLRMRLAREIQFGLFPVAPPAIPGFDIAGATAPVEEVDGDYFDYIRLADGKWAIAVGDACGHGLSAALLMVQTRASLRAAAIRGSSARELLVTANRVLCEAAVGGRFVTLALIELEPVSGRLRCCNGGHPAGYVLDADGAVRAALESTDLPLGVDPDAGYPFGGATRLRSRELLVLFTDGVSETRSGTGEFLGAARALEVVRRRRGETASRIVEAVHEAVGDFSAGHGDDVTAVVVKRL